MYDFTQIVSGYRRMCDTCFPKGGCKACPLNHLREQYDSLHPEYLDTFECLQDMAPSFPEEFAAKVEEWCMDNPVYIYPTWGRYLETIGIINPNASVATTINDLYRTPISDEIAEKLKIEPTEVKHCVSI